MRYCFWKGKMIKEVCIGEGVLNESESVIDLDRAVCKLSVSQELSEPFASPSNYCPVGEHILPGDALVSAFESVHVDEPFRQNQDSCDLEGTRPEISGSSPQRSSVTKRRSSGKRARAGVWQSHSNVPQDFEKNSNVDVNLIKHEKHIRSKRSQTTGKQRKNRSLNPLEKSSRKKSNMTGGISVNIKLGVAGLASDAVNDIEGISETMEQFSNHSREEEFAGSNASHDCKGNLLELVNASDYTVHTIHKNLDEDKASSVADAGTSPDSEVINLNVDVCSVGNGPEDLHDIQNSSGSVSLLKPIHNIENGKNSILHSGVSSPEDELLNLRTIDSEQQFMDAGQLDKPFDISDKVLSCSQGGNSSRGTQMEGGTSSEAEISAIANLEGCRSRKKVSGKEKPKPELNIDLTPSKTSSYMETGEPKISVPGVSGSGNSSLVEDVTSGPAEKSPKPRNAWVLCDNCQKWRRIPATLADQIEETKSTWTCLDNLDNFFSDCSIPQEKSNAEINAELDISDVSCDEGVCDAGINSNNSVKNQSRAPQELTWTRIKSNQYMFRKRKNQSIDEVMVCHCNPPSDGRRGCGDGCLNRMLNIECVQRACPCGEFCSNQQFQKRKYARLKMFRCGKKGHGLQVLDNITEGQFLIEYVGEVLDMRTYEARQKHYARHGHKHFYFMTLNGSEVIDACAKGNLGRFINHSCDPNCRTEKWMVNGEVCIGIFALRNIKKGEELTFDYNYVRVTGAAAKKCVCGSSQCRGYIGGDPQNAEIIVQDDSDDEFVEPVMISEGDVVDEITAEKEPLKDEAGIVNEPLDYGIGDKPDGTQAPLEVIGNKLSSVVQHAKSIEECNDSSNTSTALQVDISSETDSLTDPLLTSTSSDAVLKPDDPSELLTISDSDTKQGMSEKNGSTVHSKVLPDVRDSKKKAKADTGEGRAESAKSRTVIKSSRSSLPVKKEKSKVSPLNVRSARQTQNRYVVPGKSRKVFEDSSTSRFEAVPEKLNDLLNPDGGISKHKDASRGYLKLLLLTAASGDSYNGEPIQSNRDLSMILDALLKTKSKVVLADIINKNGLQMLHNMLKRSRKEYNKTPILRKLLKVFEYLATRGILTSEHINSRPTCRGVESFRESMLSLTEHPDRQVHQIARNFRDKWFPRPGRRHNNVNREDSRMDFHRELDRGRFPAQKRRRDQPGTNSEKPDVNTKAVDKSSTFDVCTVVGSCQPSSSGTNPGTKTRKRKSRWDQPGDLNLLVDKRMTKDGTNTCEDDHPPGFASRSLPVDNQVFEPMQSVNVVVGQPQQRFISRFPVSYGVPTSLVSQVGTPVSETLEGWSVSPGMPFHPFPPLPPYSLSNVVGSAVMGQAADITTYNQCSSAVMIPDSEMLGADYRPGFQQTRGPNTL